MPIAVLDHAELVAWICFALGVGVLITGVILGLGQSPAKAAADDEKKLKEAKKKIDELTKELNDPANRNLVGEAAGKATASAAATAEAAKSALDEVSGIVSSLPEYQRFPGLLILIGTVLIGVGTVQFGGTSLF